MVTVSAESRFDAKRERLLKAAARCFNEKGYSGTSLKDVAKHLELTDAALYYYVANKEELVYQCHQRAAALAREAQEHAIRDGESGFDQAKTYIRNHIEVIVGDQGPVAIMSEIPSLKPSHRDDILDLSRTHSAAFEAVLDRGIRDRSIAPCDVRMTGNTIMGAINWIPKWYHGNATIADTVRIQFPDILTRGLRP